MAKEILSPQKSGWTVLFFNIFLTLISIAIFIYGVVLTKQWDSYGAGYYIVGGILLLITSIIFYVGFFTVEPNQAYVLLLFGKYKGTERASGFRWTNPFYSKRKISLRVRNFDSEKLKVNDKNGNPIEISAVVVWKVADTAEAFFEVDDYLEYVHVQSESAIRHMALSYAYDNFNTEDENEITLRSSIDEVSEDLKKEIQERVGAAGVEVIEARINHLAYAQEIAHAMLQRQQAEAIIAARLKIVDGAVGMVEIALDRLKADGVVELDEERKAQMVSNLMVVLCSDKATQPVVNTGSLY
ncbi:MAG: SPFH domain-containing protein [Melioribacteraceae bacterium]|nr:SPFH domain-containing protein [Melioribacteraceae bacterium]MCF8263667.1 SPFH domain-containing protein [Melioribacteraceae bacterium]MCF8431403.1 SPFH domain-containing protein [Melioribacteraceae bacterium]